METQTQFKSVIFTTDIFAVMFSKILIIINVQNKTKILEQFIKSFNELKKIFWMQRQVYGHWFFFQINGNLNDGKKRKRIYFLVIKKVTNSALHCSILPDTLNMHQTNLFLLRMNKSLNLKVRLSSFNIKNLKYVHKNEWAPGH